ncbi:uncharacterized protein LOC143531817 [Bidens hawaiensis]|uniref:uncharacterized protein LOC143531817 n=1 Tax=Bidens hawaiensis TaxID=980011 RepID=UPI00404A600A
MAGGADKEERSNDTVMNHDSPYYLHPSDYPRQIHVNDVLTDGNYIDWKQEMQNFLFAKNKIGFMDGSIQKPKEGSSDHMAWMRCDAMIKGWLNTAMEQEIQTSVKYAYTARKKLADTKDKEKLFDFLLGLDADFGTICTQILAMQPIPSLNAAFHLVKEDEQQKAITGPKRAVTESAAFQTHVSARRDQASKPKSKEAKPNPSELFEGCTFYGKDGHKKEGCFKIIGYPDWWPGKVKQEKPKPKAVCVEMEASRYRE